ncbi:E3 Ubiquitin ligase [Halovivax ruber XH-70]|uniref:E3 Ubiquitin ligase n=1 Tax=Halovivax ruber (strain DSM 18193 / JCM 13892 / XH-70) TaxID=797302 RepID=L0IB68_HALRX|nr:E3 Ubiquitin ligase [Halovivax ruber]AGB16790.1 E3 Ubiquitin ligase [Halovivax ruber XH-70]
MRSPSAVIVGTVGTVLGGSWSSAAMITPSVGWPVVLGGVGLVGLLVALGYGLRELRLAHRILRSGTESVLETTEGGYVELRGRVEPADTALEAPFTGTACVACEYAVEEEQASQHGTTWTTIESGSGVVPFHLDDGSGAILVEPEGCQLRLTRDDRIEVDGGTPAPPRIQSYIDRTESVSDENDTLDLRVIEVATGADRRYVEKRLDVGATAHVLGTARYDTTVATEAGQVNAAVGRSPAASAASRVQRLSHRLFGLPFVVSDRSERRLGLTAGAIGLGLVLIACVVLAVGGLLLGAFG